MTLPEALPPDVPEAIKPVFAWFESHVEKLSSAYATLERRVGILDRQLEHRNAELESLLDSLHDGVLMVDLDEHITMVNGRGAQILALDPLEVIGKSLTEVFPFQKDFTDPLLHSLHEGQPLRWVEVVWLRSLDTPIPLGVSTAPVRDPQDRSLGAVASFQNLTHTKQLERELSQTRTLAALGQMAATVAHEIRNPLGGIGGFARLLERDLRDDEKRRQLAERIIEGVGSLNKIVTNLLAYTKPMETQLRDLEIKPWLEELAVWCRTEAEGAATAELEITVEVEPRLRTARFDPEKLRLVMLNLALNAIQAISGPGRIVISARRAPGLLILGVEDSGAGIPPEAINEIFNPFFTTKENGTGLGLAIVRKIVELHGGNLFVESLPGTGSRFDIHLPQPIQD